MLRKNSLLALVGFCFALLMISGVSANSYVADFSFTIPDSVFSLGENISLKGTLSQANYTDAGALVTNLTIFSGAVINVTIENATRTRVSNYTFTTDSLGAFYSRSNFYPVAVNVSVPNASGDYYLRANYKDPNGTLWFSEAAFKVVNQSVDILQIGSAKAVYNPSETVNVEIAVIRAVGDKILYVSNVSVNGSLRNASQSVISSFNCTTSINGKCSVSLTAPTTYGQYILELENFKAFSSFYVTPFLFSVYMKDELGKSLKNIYALGEQARVEVGIANASTGDEYTFSGYVVDANGNVLKTISSTTLNSNNSYINSFLFTVDSLTFSYGAHRAVVTVSKTGDGSLTSTTPFEIRDWTLTLAKRSSNAGFEYEYSVFPNKTMFFEAYPTYRSNGSLIQGINSSFFSISMKDSQNNIIAGTNATWNSTCSKEGCYQFSLNSSTIMGQYVISATLSYAGLTQTKTQSINVINGVMSAQSTDGDSTIKELFGATDYIYIKLSVYNTSSAYFNLSDAQLYLVRYMNGTELNYTQAANFSMVNVSNSVNEWAWNSTLQQLKLDVPKVGGTYLASILADNSSLGASARFIINPYDVCTSAKDTPGNVGSGNYYVWQFKKTDTIYFEMKVTQAVNPTGKASALNGSNSSGGSYGLGSACSIDTTQKQVVSNATITIKEVRNAESGALQSFNTTASFCQTSDASGGYSCTLKPLNKWEGGINSVLFSIQGIDGTSSITTARFESRSFYLYGYPQSWQNSPSSNLTLNVRIYEAGSNWWGGMGSAGLSGTVTLKKVEYQGRDGEWIWPPVDFGYNASSVNSSSITSGSGTLTLPVSSAPNSQWKTGYYRAVVQAVTSSGDTDYGYAWFGVKQWDVYGQPIECTNTGCNYKSYFNSKENVSIYVKISPAGDYNYNYQGGQSLGGGNVSISVKKIMDCRTYPCKELNSSDYVSNTLKLNESSPWYWNANIQNNSKYLISINTTKGTWNTGYYSVVLDVNGTDTGSAWFNTLAFYVEAQPTNITGSGYKYSIRGNQPMYFNVTSTRNYKTNYGSGARYNVTTDYLNTTVSAITLRSWDPTTQKSVEYKYPQHINITSPNITGNSRLNLSYVNGSWPTGYYWGELTLANSVNETSTGWLWFNVRPFRVQVSSNSYSIDSDQCINGTLSVYDPDWYSSTLYAGNYSIVKVYEDVWSPGSVSQTVYTNFTNSSFNATLNGTFCPNSGAWSSGSWGGYHYLTVIVKDNVQNDTDSGWLSFRTIPFQISWGSISGGTSKATNAAVIVPATLTKSTGGNATGNITRIYQWRYDASTQYQGTKEEYIFNVGSCYSNISGQCSVNGTQNVTIYPPSTGWKIGYNYLQAEWGKQTDSTSKIEDWSSIYFEGREAYSGYFSNSDLNSNYKYNFNTTENITIKLFARDVSYNSVAVNVTNVQYSLVSSSCYSEWCRSYTSATWGVAGGGIQISSSGSVITIKAPSGGWTKGEYSIKVSVSSAAGSGTITGGSVKVRDSITINITVNSPVNNATYNQTLLWNITTSVNAKCNVGVSHYNGFNQWYCGGWNSTNSSNGTVISQQTIGACNTTLYNYNGIAYYIDYVSNDYRSTYNGSDSSYSSGSTGLITGGTRHTYTFNNISGWTAQHYGMQVNCYDEDYNYATAQAAFKVVR